MTKTQKPHKILGYMIQQYIENIIYHDHVGFMSGIQRWFNICKVDQSDTPHLQNEG